MKLSEFKALTFDCYGTLIDWESGMIAGLAPLTSRLQKPLSRNEILEAHARHESAQQRWTPSMRYADLLAIPEESHRVGRHASVVVAHGAQHGDEGGAEDGFLFRGKSCVCCGSAHSAAPFRNIGLI